MQLISQETIQIRRGSGFVPRVISNPGWTRRDTPRRQWPEPVLDAVDLAKQQGLLDRLHAILTH